MATERSSEHVAFDIAGTHYEVTSLVGTERLSALFEFTVTCAIDGPPPSANGLIGRTAAITLHDGMGQARTISGIVAAARSSVYDNDQARLAVVVRPAAFALTLGRDCRAFQDSTVVDIVQAVVAKAGCPNRFAITGSYPVRPYTVQYRENDWRFACRLLEENGIYYWFDHAAGSMVVFADDSATAPDAPGGATIAFAYESGLHAAGEVIEELASGTQATSTKFTVGSFDPDKPNLTLRESAGEGSLEVYSCRGGGVTSAAECAKLAQLGAERAGASKSSVMGIATSVRLFPGVVFECDNHTLSALDGRYLVTAASYEVHQRTRAGGEQQQRRYRCRFTAISAGTTYRPPRETPQAQQPGAQSGVVIGAAGEEVYPDPRGRVRVQQYWDRLGGRDEVSGTWMRVAQRGSAESMLLPRIGWSVLTFNEEGAVDTPSVFNRIPDGEHLPPYPLPANKTRLVFKTATTPGGGSFNEIRFEDRKGQEEMFLNASKDMNILVQRSAGQTVHRDQRREVGVDHTLTADADVRHHVKRDRREAVGGNETLTTAADHSVTVEGNHTVSVGGKRSLDVGAKHTTNVDKNRALGVSAAMIDVCLGPISANGGVFTTLVGGAIIKLSGGMVSESAGKASAQLIGGARLEMAKADRTTDVKSAYAETVGGAVILKTDGKYTDNADETSTWTVGGALQVEAKSVFIEAPEKIELRCGQTTITLEPETIRIKTPKLDLTGDKLQLDAAEVTHN